MIMIIVLVSVQECCLLLTFVILFTLELLETARRGVLEVRVGASVIAVALGLVTVGSVALSFASALASFVLFILIDELLLAIIDLLVCW